VNKDQIYGVVILVGGLAGLAVYTWLLYMFPMVVLQVTAFLAVAAVLVILAWIGWTMATTPPPEPIDFEAPPATGPEEATKSASASEAARTKAES